MGYHFLKSLQNKTIKLNIQARSLIGQAVHQSGWTCMFQSEIVFIWFDTENNEIFPSKLQWYKNHKMIYNLSKFRFRFKSETL